MKIKHDWKEVSAPDYRCGRCDSKVKVRKDFADSDIVHKDIDRVQFRCLNEQCENSKKWFAEFSTIDGNRYNFHLDWKAHLERVRKEMEEAESKNAK